jgi:preprotein translocase subunit SecD
VKKNALKKIFILLSVLGSLYFLYPTYKDYTLSQELKNLHGDDSLKFIDERETDIRDARAKRVKLGLDLQGGMRVVLEVNVAKLLDDVAKNARRRSGVGPARLSPR